jgi:hypothetical protein
LRQGHCIFKMNSYKQLISIATNNFHELPNCGMALSLLIAYLTSGVEYLVWTRYRNKSISDFLWKLFNKARPLGHTIRRFANNVKCPICPNTVETHEHFIFDCPASTVLWNWLSRVWQKGTGRTVNNTLINRLLWSNLPRVRKSVKHKWHVMSTLHGELL